MMGEYVIANIVNHERNLMAVYENQQGSLWNRDGKISNHRSISDLTIGILGAGTIGTDSESKSYFCTLFTLMSKLKSISNGKYHSWYCVPLKS